MSESESERVGAPRRPPTARIVFVSTLAVSLGVLLAAPAFPVIRDTLTVQSDTVQALAMVGVVLGEAIVLYVCYGALIAIVEPSIRELVGGDVTWNSSE
ncbi:DUF7512 family protein [Halomicrococcus sp. NG-SE-24]|uniref:DUF7512 family protein n=1 Tax=Halomicrococcus sp. NG-SE-24 TaxID=3436928 RepID=UPI003D95E3B9